MAQLKLSDSQHANAIHWPIRFARMAGINGKQIVGSFHTHPNLGAEWRQEPSVQDVRLSQEYPETMGLHQFVIAKETIYHIDNDGAVKPMGTTRQLLGIATESTE